MPPLIFPQASTAAALALIVAQALTLRLYSNPYTPVPGSSFANFTEVSGGGYAAFPLVSGSWGITPGSPSVALYGAYVPFLFAAVPAVSTVYGYFVTNAANLVVYAEQFHANGDPWVISAGRTCQVRPRFGADNLVGTPTAVV